MLQEFLISNRNELITRCREKAAQRFRPSEIPSPTGHGVPLFLQQLVDTLRLEQVSLPHDVGEQRSMLAHTEIARTAALHGTELLGLGYSVDQVVHDYGDVCQSVTELAVEQMAQISVDEFRILNLCLDDAIADAVSSFGRARQILMKDQADTLTERLNSFSEEYMRLVRIAIQAYSAIKTGTIGYTGATGTLLTHALDDLRALGDRSLPEIR